MTVGIYCIENTINGKKYIGQSVNIEKRINQHKFYWGKAHFNETCGENKPLWNSIKKNGVEKFSIYILEECDISSLDKTETFYIDTLKTLVSYNGYNILRDGFSRRGIKHSKEAKLKMSLSLKGKKRTDEAKKNISNGKKGIPRTDNMIAMLADMKRGKHQNPEHIEKHRLALIDKKMKNSSSIYLGVSFDKSRNKWVAHICIDKKQKNLGRFDTEFDAALRYNTYIINNKLDRKLNNLKEV